MSNRLSRPKASLDDVPKQIDAMRARSAKPRPPPRRHFAPSRSADAGLPAEMKNYALGCPHHLCYLACDQDKAHDLTSNFTARPLQATWWSLSAKRAVSSGDAIHGILPFIADGF